MDEIGRALKDNPSIKVVKNQNVNGTLKKEASGYSINEDPGNTLAEIVKNGWHLKNNSL